MPNRTSVALNYVEKGAGIPVLALHGWTPDHRLMLGCLEPVFGRRTGYRRLYRTWSCRCRLPPEGAQWVAAYRHWARPR